MVSRPDISVVIPAYNESRRIGPTLQRIGEYATEDGRVWELIVVDDGSADGTAEVVNQLDVGGVAITMLVNERNRGKGYSVRRGMLEATGARVLMCDADLSTPIEELTKLEPLLGQGYDVVIASRDVAESRLDPPQPAHRRLLAWMFRNVRRAFLLRSLNDTQCGFKLFTAAAARDVFERLVDEGFIFDVEALAIAHRLGYRIAEIGVMWRDDRDSRVQPSREALRCLTALWRIRRRVRQLEKR